MEAILNSAIMNLAISESAILVFPLKHTHTCQDWFPPFAQKKNFTHTSLPTIWTKKLHSFILTQLDDGGHLEFGLLEFCHLGFIFCIMEFRHLVFFSQIYSKILSLHSDSDSNYSIWLKLIHSHSTWWWWPSWILQSWILPSWIQLLPCWNQTPIFPLWFTQKHSPCTLILIQTNSIWLKLIYSHSTLSWQPFWILPSWIPPTWIQPC